MLKGTGGGGMDKFWALFCATGEPVFYLMYRRDRADEEDRAETV